MRSLNLVAVAALALMSLAGPSLAATVTLSKASPALLKAASGITRFCIPPRQLENVCVKWAPGAPGTFSGPCIKYQLECVSAPVIH